MTDMLAKAEPKDLSAPEGIAALATERKPATAATDEMVRAEAVGELLTKAYSQASTLQLTPSESKALRADFADHAIRGGAKGDARILYISHIHLSDRLNDVLGIGQWALVKRNQRAEQTKTADGKPLVRIYYEGVMLIRGAFVGEAIGVGQYHPNNPKEDYGTGLESAMSDCLTRCCKRLGIGSQTWDKSFCDDWNQKYGQRRPVPMPKATDAPAPEPTPEPAAETKAPGDEQAAKPTPPAEPSDHKTFTGTIIGVNPMDGKKPAKVLTEDANKNPGPKFVTWDKAMIQTATDFGAGSEPVVITYDEQTKDRFTNLVIVKIERIS